MMEVCTDVEFNGDKSHWFYSGDKYIRKLSNGAVMAEIKDIPDPYELWKHRCNTYGAAYPAESIFHPKTGREIRLKPTEAVFKLFSHWEQVKCQP